MDRPDIATPAAVYLIMSGGPFNLYGRWSELLADVDIGLRLRYVLPNNLLTNHLTASTTTCLKKIGIY
jgi:hypothetical protein